LNRIKRIIIIVLDGFGIGGAPDAADYGDEGSDTLGNIALSTSNFCLAKLNSLGLTFLNESYQKSCVNTYEADITGSYGIMQSKTAGKDTTVGHWEMMGVILDTPFPVYGDSFPEHLVKEISKLTGKGIIGNEVASGTEIINRLGDRHVETGELIVYTSADSVMQIAAHEDIVPPEELYRYCKIARGVMIGEHAVSRIIARPFVGSNGNFHRTIRRKDFSVKPPHLTALDYIQRSGFQVKGVGKIFDIFSGKGITDSISSSGNEDGIEKTIRTLKSDFEGLLFVNLIDFDMLFGHRNDVAGYANSLMQFDARLPEILNSLNNSDILFITADHGCDPTTASTDHTRERVPILVFGKSLKSGVDIGIRETFADIGATILHILEIKHDLPGKEFYSILEKGSENDATPKGH
jgi:phosphopentomutase